MILTVGVAPLAHLPSLPRQVLRKGVLRRGTAAEQDGSGKEGRGVTSDGIHVWASGWRLLLEPPCPHDRRAGGPGREQKTVTGAGDSDVIPGRRQLALHAVLFIAVLQNLSDD